MHEEPGKVAASGPAERRRRLQVADMGAAGLIGIVASAIAIWAFFFRTPAESGEDAAGYEGAIETYAEQQSFVNFTERHHGSIVKLNVWMTADEAPDTQKQGSRNVSFFNLFFDCPPGVAAPSIDAGCTGMEYGIYVDRSGDASYGYNQGANYLHGYFTVRANPGTHQGYLSTSLISVRTEDAP